eukprot:1136325-Pelagomonas_calceolata.AAC.7
MSAAGSSGEHMFPPLSTDVEGWPGRGSACMLLMCHLRVSAYVCYRTQDVDMPSIPREAGLLAHAVQDTMFGPDIEFKW